MNSPAQGPLKERRLWVERADQATAAVILFLALAAMAVFGVWIGLSGGGVIDIDTAEPLSADFKVNVNEAEWPELAMLPEIGESLAKRIVEYREDHGPFHRLEELRHVKGIGEKTFAEIQPYLLPIEAQPVAAE